MEIIGVALGVINLILLIFLIFKKPNSDNSLRTELEKSASQLQERLIRIESEVDKFTPKVSQEFRENRKEITSNFQNIEKSVDTRIKSLQDDNSKKLDAMRETVDEKLRASVEKRFNESFKTISGQLTQVYQGLGEMKHLATGVGDLKKVMEGVKTRGVYGEVQLGSIISDMLAPDQYLENAITKKGSNDRVEFPIENYSRLIAAYDSGEKSEIIKYTKALSADVKEQAKKISTKYLNPPETTSIGIMFVPTESLYAEILRIPGLSEELRQKHHINIASPSTLPVVLSSLLMGFRTVAIEKHSHEIWQTLGAVKAQFGKFGDLLAQTKKKLEETANKIGSAETTSRQIERKLKNVETLPESDSVKLIGDISQDLS